MLNKKDEFSLIYNLSRILAQELTIYEANNIRGAILHIEKGNEAIKQVIEMMLSDNALLNDHIQHLEKNFHNNIQQLKIIKKLVNIARKYSQEPGYFFEHHSLIPALETLNIFFSEKVLNDDGLKYNVGEMLHQIKQNSKELERTCNYIDKLTFNNDEQFLLNLSSLSTYIDSIACNIEQIKSILEAPPRTKKSKKSNKKH